MAMPALLTNASRRPNRSFTAATARETAAGSATSQAMAMVVSGLASVAKVRARLSPSMSRSATRQSSARKRFAAASPMPRAAPVTNATFAMLPPEPFGYGSMPVARKASGAFAARFVYTRGMHRIVALAAFVALSAAAHAQDIRWREVCTAEKSIERRTSCLQSNVEFLQQALTKQARETKARLDAAVCVVVSCLVV